MTEIVLPRGSPCHIISLLSYQVQIKPAALAVNVVIEQTRNTLFMYRHLTITTIPPKVPARLFYSFGQQQSK